MKRHRSSGNLSHTGVGCQMFSDHDLEQIHLATLEVLEEEGVWLEGQEAMTVFEDGGAMVDRDNQKVKIPPFMVEEAVEAAPAQVVLCGRHPKDDVILEATECRSCHSAWEPRCMIPTPESIGIRP